MTGSKCSALYIPRRNVCLRTYLIIKSLLLGSRARARMARALHERNRAGALGYSRFRMSARFFRDTKMYILLVEVSMNMVDPFVWSIFNGQNRRPQKRDLL